MNTIKSKAVLLTLLLLNYHHICFAYVDPNGSGSSDNFKEFIPKLFLCCISLILNVICTSKVYSKPTLFVCSIAILSALFNSFFSIRALMPDWKKSSHGIDMEPLVFFVSILIFGLVSIRKSFREIKKFDITEQTNFIYIALIKISNFSIRI